MSPCCFALEVKVKFWQGDVVGQGSRSLASIMVGMNCLQPILVPGKKQSSRAPPPSQQRAYFKYFLSRSQSQMIFVISAATGRASSRAAFSSAAFSVAVNLAPSGVSFFSGDFGFPTIHKTSYCYYTYTVYM
jgi:hypothetical protein